MRAKVGIFLLSLALALSVSPANATLSAAAIPTVFDALLKSATLSNPAMVLIDGATGEVVYEKNPNSARKPASVIKILAGVATLKYLDPQSVFTTSISLGVEKKTLVIAGSYDPWISLDHKVARKMNRASLPNLGFKSISAIKKVNKNSLKKITVLYSGLYPQDVANLKRFWAKRGFRPVMKAIKASQVAPSSGDLVVRETSPPISEILDFTIKWSDNYLADRLARLSSRAAGNAFSFAGAFDTYKEILTDLEIDSSKLSVIDGSGLSKENRMSAKMMGELLYKIRKDARYNLLYEFMPLGGVSGTLRSRFLTTAPQAIGLVRAKTGSLNGTVTLAGYVESVDREYIFVILADKIPRGTRANLKAREAIDRILGKIAAPIIQVETPEVIPVETPEAIPAP
jgi:D-alanyl-D-alanine carboxypeptidase